MKDELLIKFLLNESNSEENDEVKDWLTLSSENTVYLAQLEKIWIESKKLDVKKDVDIEAAWEKFKGKANRVQTVKLRPMHIWMRIAAVIVLAVGSLTLYTIYKSQGYTDINTDAQVLSQVLPDGSELTLNKFSQIKFANNFENNRNVELDSGDVFFKVKKDKSKPFIVKVNKISVQVIGTSFNVKYLKQQTEVVVETGIVKVSLGTSEVLLHKGEKVIIPKGVTKLEKLLANDQLYNYYRSKLFIADKTPLPTLIAVLNEAYAANVVLEGEAKDLTITTTLPFSKSLEENLSTIIETFEKLKIKRNQNEIILSY